MLAVGPYRGVTVGPFVEACISLIVHATRLGMDPDKALPSYNCNQTFIPSAQQKITIKYADWCLIIAKRALPISKRTKQNTCTRSSEQDALLQQYKKNNHQNVGLNYWWKIISIVTLDWRNWAS